MWSVIGLNRQLKPYLFLLRKYRINYPLSVLVNKSLFVRNFDCLELVFKEISYLVYLPSRSIFKPENHAALLAFPNKLAIRWAKADTELNWHETLDFSQNMGSEKFSLRWNDFESSISSSVGDLRDSEQFLDLTLVCGDDQIRAHKVCSNAWLLL